MTLDLLDSNILYELEKDSHIPITKLSKKLKKSKEVIWYRMNRLQEKKILLGFGAIVDMSALGYFTFRAYIKWQNMTFAERENFNKEIMENDDIWTIATLHGKWDVAFFIGIKSIEFINRFHEIWNDIQNKYKDKIAESKIAIYSPIHNFNKTFFMKKDYSKIERVYGKGEVVSFDKLDEALVREYTKNVRIPLTELSKKLKFSVETIRQRIKKLEKKKVIVGYKIDLDLKKLGFQGYRVDFTLKSTERNKELFEYLKQHKYFYQINKSIGGADFETEIVVKDLQQLLQILEEVNNRFSDVINGYEYMGYSLFPKLTLIPD